MAEKKRTLVDYGLQVLRELLRDKTQGGAQNVAAAAKVTNLNDLKLDDLRREKIRLEQEERKMLSELRTTEDQKRKLFEEGVRNPSEREQRAVARRIKEIDLQAQSMDRMLQAVSKQMRIINGLIQVKERARVMAESGISSILKDIDLQDLIIYIDKASVDGEFHMDKFDELLRTLEQADAISPQFAEDQDVLDIVKQMQMAREAADSPEAIEARFAEMNRQMEAKSREKELEASEEEI